MLYPPDFDLPELPLSYAHKPAIVLCGHETERYCFARSLSKPQKFRRLLIANNAQNILEARSLLIGDSIQFIPSVANDRSSPEQLILALGEDWLMAWLAGTELASLVADLADPVGRDAAQAVLKLSVAHKIPLLVIPILPENISLVIRAQAEAALAKLLQIGGQISVIDLALLGPRTEDEDHESTVLENAGDALERIIQMANPRSRSVMSPDEPGFFDAQSLRQAPNKVFQSVVGLGVGSGDESNRLEMAFQQALSSPQLGNLPPDVRIIRAGFSIRSVCTPVRLADIQRAARVVHERLAKDDTPFQYTIEPLAQGTFPNVEATVWAVAA
jgi:hypothetical protein